MVAVLLTVTFLPSIVRFTILTSCQNQLGNRLFDCHEAAGVVTGGALSALLLVDDRHPALFPGNGVHRADLEAEAAFLAGVLHHLELEQFLAGVRRAALLLDVRLVLVPEVANGGEDGIGGRLPEAAE